MKTLRVCSVVGSEQLQIRIDKNEEEKDMKRENLKGLRQLWKEEDGMGTVEVILIIVVLVGLVLIFRKQLTTLVNNLFSKITQQADSI